MVKWNSGDPIVGPPFPYYSHKNLLKYGKLMGRESQYCGSPGEVRISKISNLSSLLSVSIRSTVSQSQVHAVSWSMSLEWNICGVEQLRRCSTAVSLRFCSFWIHKKLTLHLAGCAFRKRNSFLQPQCFRSYVRFCRCRLALVWLGMIVCLLFWFWTGSSFTHVLHFFA